MSFDTNYGNYRSMGIDDGLPDFDDVFTDDKYVRESISELVDVLGTDGYLGYKALTDGQVPFYVVPQGTDVIAQPSE